jgi:3-oxo-5-alpha-steroid 4-dehydrogenase 1
MEVVSLAVFAFSVLFFFSEITLPLTIMAALWVGHYGYRTLLFPWRMRRSTKRFPLMVVLFAFLFNGINAWINGWHIAVNSGRYGDGWMLDPRMICGLAVFVLGFLIHRHSDSILLSLRKSGEKEYSIPRSGLFRYVTAANYLGEIVQWCGWALLTWSLPGLAFALFTMANLVPRAIKHHAWYKEHFPDYPKERKVLIPFVF